MISDCGLENWWKVRKWKSTTRIWILIKQSTISHSSGFIFSYLEIIPSKKDTIKRVVIKVWNLWFVITSKVLRFALEMISCTTCAEMIRVASAWHLFRKSMKYELWGFGVLNRSFSLNLRWYFNITSDLKFTFQKQNSTKVEGSIHCWWIIFISLALYVPLDVMNHIYQSISA